MRRLRSVLYGMSVCQWGACGAAVGQREELAVRYWIQPERRLASIALVQGRERALPAAQAPTSCSKHARGGSSFLCHSWCVVCARGLRIVWCSRLILHVDVVPWFALAFRAAVPRAFRGHSRTLCGGTNLALCVHTILRSRVTQPVMPVAREKRSLRRGRGTPHLFGARVAGGAPRSNIEPTWSCLDSCRGHGHDSISILPLKPSPLPDTLR